MNLTSYIFGILTATTILVVIVELLRRNRLRERHSIWWLIGGILGLIASIFPSTLTWAAGIVGVEEPINLMFFLGIVLLSLICIQHSSELTVLEEKTRSLNEHSAFLAMRVDNLENKIKNQAGGSKE